MGSYKIGHQRIYDWSEKEKAEHNTERHRLFKAELYSHLSGQDLSREEKTEVVKVFKENHPYLFEEDL